MLILSEKASDNCNYGQLYLYVYASDNEILEHDCITTGHDCQSPKITVWHV
jgi:hypothetical protein